MNEAKGFDVAKQMVWESWLQVKANKGSTGIDGINLKPYNSNIDKNLYKLWNRMSSGSYFPKAVKLVEITKPNGGKRPLGIPTAEDRVAQMVVVMYIMPRLEAIFHEDYYGYRPLRSAHSAIAKAWWKSLENYIEDGRVEISNNFCEQLMKTVKLNLKNCQNIDSVFAAENAAFIFSVTESCSLNGINPERYIEDILRSILFGTNRDKREFLPCYYQAHELPEMNAIEVGRLLSIAV